MRDRIAGVSCNQCRNLNPIGQAFCGACGANLKGNGESELQPAAGPPRSRQAEGHSPAAGFLRNVYLFPFVLIAGAVLSGVFPPMAAYAVVLGLSGAVAFLYLRKVGGGWIRGWGVVLSIGGLFGILISLSRQVDRVAAESKAKERAANAELQRLRNSAKAKMLRAHLVAQVAAEHWKTAWATYEEIETFDPELARSELSNERATIEPHIEAIRQSEAKERRKATIAKGRPQGSTLNAATAASDPPDDGLPRMYATELVTKVRLGPSATAKATGELYRRDRVTIYETKDGWARVTRYYAGITEDVEGEVARWVPLSALSNEQPRELPQPRLKEDSRITGIPKVGENGLTEKDVRILHAAAEHFLATGEAKLVEYGDKSVDKPGVYYLNLGGPRNRFFRPEDIPSLRKR